MDDLLHGRDDQFKGTTGGTDTPKVNTRHPLNILGLVPITLPSSPPPLLGTRRSLNILVLVPITPSLPPPGGQAQGGEACRRRGRDAKQLPPRRCAPAHSYQQEQVLHQLIHLYNSTTFSAPAPTHPIPSPGCFTRRCGPSLSASTTRTPALCMRTLLSLRF